MYATEPRQIVRHRAKGRYLVRHRAKRQRVTSVARPYPMVAAVLVGLASVPMLAAVLAGSAELNPTSAPRSPMVADQSPVPVVVSGTGGATAAPSAASAPGPSPDPTTGVMPETTAQAAATPGPVTQEPTAQPRRSPAGTGGFGQHPGSGRQPSTPAQTSSGGQSEPAPSHSGGNSSGGGAPSLPLPTLPPPPLPLPLPTPTLTGTLPTIPGTLPTVPGILPSLTDASAPTSAGRVTGTVVGGLGDLLGVDGLRGGR
ncbi:hypothetical protein HC031_03170 [Planosporangium thailandense]|uniref:Uncharacterized protein n=1 Tax=Planosporangium thailandense TaxID=765197 RepID=A0ABX0XRU4_9ACTN|nr:hypothetical protein [Planosporangium thailandense]NJC68732.1 hypothetical protein [Planosporangium thailandense]